VSDEIVSSDTIHTWIRVEVTTEETKGTGGNESIVIVDTKGIGTTSIVGEIIYTMVEMMPSVVEMILVVEAVIPISTTVVLHLCPCLLLLPM
jgi:hypothetical protein